MVIENAVITIDPKTADAFEQAVSQCAGIFRAAEGCHGMALERIVDNPSRYRLLVKWETIAYHESIFWETEGFKEWRSRVGKFFVAAPSLEYFETVATYF